ncbi:MAG TPA: SDR family NAD(P)-dependent oxidoreductase [Burkholderiales bacterium]|nr:SDR family NAD(P)-dependent oxidoreductase [Burkholderiales bacterium]
MSSATLASKTFDADDQAAFARLSGDVNPLHMDPLAARRTQAGTTVVHGIHAVLWALDRLVESGAAGAGIASLKVQFAKFIPVGGTVALKLVRRDDRSIRAELALGALTTTILNVGLGQRRKGEAGETRDGPAVGLGDRPAVLARPEEAAGLSGSLDTAGPARSVASRFPHAVASMGPERVAAVVLLSSLVGMVCPGLHSIFAAFAVDFTDAPGSGLGFGVTGIDDRFRMVRMAVRGAGVEGSVQAFMRWPPVAQASMSEVSKLVAPDEFAATTTLIVGGSRGLGALTAKVIAAGGGKVIATYARGREEAQQLAGEIRGHAPKGTCDIIPYDARRSPAAQLDALATGVSHLYYFASAPIARQKEGVFVPDLFDEFVQVYVKGFHDCCRFLGERGSLTAFYPSSVFVGNPPQGMLEYAMAKIAGELLCDGLNRAGGRVRVTVERLPRLLTDQTATVPPVDAGDPLEVMLPVIRRVQSTTFDQG